MKVSGPVVYYKLKFRDRIVRLFADLHNSTEGGCDGDCLRYNENYQKVGNKTSCYTLTRYLDYVFSKNQNKSPINFYFESAFVVKDPRVVIKPSLEGLDHIDRITAIFADSLLRDKSHSLYFPKAHLHYVDIRDFYHTDYNDKGFRKTKSANPFSGSWLASNLTDERSFYQGATLLRFILDNADEIKDIFLSEEFRIPQYTSDNKFFRYWKERLVETSQLTSTFKGKRVHRVAKQLLKLNSKDRDMIIGWCNRRFEEQKKMSYNTLAEWESQIKLKGDKADRDEPIMVLIPLSSVIMDTYVLARMLYQKSSSDVFFAGLAHIHNYLDFFETHGGELLKSAKGTDNKMRCVECL